MNGCFLPLMQLLEPMHLKVYAPRCAGRQATASDRLAYMNSLCSLKTHILYKPGYCCIIVARVAFQLQRHEDSGRLQRYRQGSEAKQAVSADLSRLKPPSPISVQRGLRTCSMAHMIQRPTNNLLMAALKLPYTT